VRNKFYSLDLWSLSVRVFSFLTANRLMFQNHDFSENLSVSMLTWIGGSPTTYLSTIIPTHSNCFRELVLIIGDSNLFSLFLVITQRRASLLQSYTSKSFGLKTSYWVIFSLNLSLLICDALFLLYSVILLWLWVLYETWQN